MLGNASPRELEIDYSMGGMALDLRGRWLVDSEIEIRTSMSGAMVRLPKDVNIRGLAATEIAIQDEAEPGRPTLTFKSSSEMGDLEFVR
jgi:hypothetical protein